MTNSLLEQFQTKCATYLTTRSADFDRNEYKQCLDEQMNFVNYINEQNELLNTLRSCANDIDRFLQRLKSIHQYELKQKEVFEQILHELTPINPSSSDERRRLFEQIDELILSKVQLTAANQFELK